MCFVYSVVWACGGFLTAENKAVFDSWWRSIACDMKAQFPDSGLLWDFYVKPGCPTYVPWRESVPHYSPPSDTETAPYVHTVQSTAIQHVVSMLIDRCYPVLLNGAIGSGKTSLLLEALKTHCISGVTDASLLHVTGSGCTGPGVVWDQLLECLQWRWGRRFSPRESKRLICFIDDLHTFQVGTQSFMLCRQSVVLTSIPPSPRDLRVPLSRMCVRWSAAIWPPVGCTWPPPANGTRCLMSAMLGLCAPHPHTDLHHSF